MNVHVLKTRWLSMPSRWRKRPGWAIAAVMVYTLAGFLTDDDFRQLASRRAERVKDYLLQVGKVEGERIFLAEGATPAKGSRAYIHLR